MLPFGTDKDRIIIKNNIITKDSEKGTKDRLSSLTIIFYLSDADIELETKHFTYICTRDEIASAYQHTHPKPH